MQEAIKKRQTEVCRTLVASLIVILSVTAVGRANTRTLESRFALAASARSEFRREFPMLSPGRILVEANWDSITAARTAALTLSLIKPDGSIATSKSGTSVLRLEHRVSEHDLDGLASTNGLKWTVKILNDADLNQSEVSGTLRITIPIASRTLEDTQFTLLGSGNAQEIPFRVPAPGRIEVDVTWEPDLGLRIQVPLLVSLIHPGESRTYARRQVASPTKVEQQITEQALDRGERWVLRVQNNTQVKVNGRVRVNYTPSL